MIGQHSMESLNGILIALYYAVDGFLISFYRLTEVPIFGYYIGTGVVCLICVIIGQMTYCWAYRRNGFMVSESGKITRWLYES